MWNLLNPLDPTYSYGNRVHVQRRVHACGSDSNRAQSSACMRDLACNLSASLVCALLRSDDGSQWREGCSVCRGTVDRLLALPGAASAQNPFYTVFFIAGSQPLIEEQSSVPTGTHRSDGIVASTDTTFHTTQGALAMTVQDVCTPRVMGTANSTQPPAATEQSSRRDAVVFNPSYKICAMGGRKGGEAATRQHAATL